MTSTFASISLHWPSIVFQSLPSLLALRHGFLFWFLITTACVRRYIRMSSSPFLRWKHPFCDDCVLSLASLCRDHGFPNLSTWPQYFREVSSTSTQGLQCVRRYVQLSSSPFCNEMNKWTCGQYDFMSGFLFWRPWFQYLEMASSL